MLNLKYICLNFCILEPSKCVGLAKSEGQDEMLLNQGLCCLLRQNDFS